MYAHLESLAVQVGRRIPVDLQPGDVVVVVVGLFLLTHVVAVLLAVHRQTGILTRGGVRDLADTLVRNTFCPGMAVAYLVVRTRAIGLMFATEIEDGP